MKSARLDCNLINCINISKERIYHSELQSASRGRTENGKSERQTLATLPSWNFPGEEESELRDFEYFFPIGKTICRVGCHLRLCTQCHHTLKV